MALIEQTRDAQRVNALVNNEAVRDRVALGLPGMLDLTQIVEDPRNHTFVGDHGVIIFALVQEPGIYETHASVLPQGRGEWTMEAGNEALDAMFGEHEARLIVFTCPRDNLAACYGAQMLGATRIKTTEEWSIYAMNRADWHRRRRCQ